MRNILILGLAAAALVPAVAQAQSAGELHRDRQNIERQQREVDRDLARGDHRGARENMRDLREARQEYREDWRDYRRAHADRFRGPAYVGPRGHAYRPVAPGYRFGREYYARRYWLDNPGSYRLPAVGPNDRYVRYGRDVIRVDIRNGRVLQVFGSFFL